MSIAELTAELEERLYSDGSVDSIQMIQQSNMVMTIVQLVLGILSILIIILVPLITSLELVYICFPVIRNKTDELIFNIENKGTQHKVLGFAFRDARQAVTEANVGMIGERSALWIYLKLKFKSIFFVFFVLAFVLRGHSIITFVDNLFGRIIEMIF